MNSSLPLTSWCVARRLAGTARCGRSAFSSGSSTPGTWRPPRGSVAWSMGCGVGSRGRRCSAACPTRVCGSRTLDPLTVWLRDQAKQALHGTVLPRSATTKGPRRRKPDRMTKPLVMVNHQGLCCISLPLRDRPGRRASTPVRRSAPHEPRGRATQRCGISPPASSQGRYVVLLLRIPYSMTHRFAQVPLWLAREVQPEVLQCLVGDRLLAASGRLDDRLVVLGVQPRLYRA